MELGDLSENLQTLVSGLQALRSLLSKDKAQEASGESLYHLNTVVTDMQDAVMNAQAIALEAQTERSKLLARIDELQVKVKQADDWDKETHRYELTEYGASIVYKIRKNKQDGEPFHYLCPVCFQDRVKTILQLQGLNSLYCGRCRLPFNQFV